MASSTESRKFDKRPPPLRTVTNIPETPTIPLDNTRSLPIKVPGRNSPKSSSWEETMNDLSRELQLICGSPPNTGSMSPCRVKQPLASPGPFAFGEIPTSPLPSNPRKLVLIAHARDLRRTNSVQSHGSRPAQRPIFVRHIETQAELKNRLVEICRTGQSPEGVQRTGSPFFGATDTPTIRFSFARPPFDRSTVRVRIPTAPHPAEELIISVREKRHLVVETVSGCGKFLHQSTLSGDVKAAQLVAQLSDDGILVVRERPTKMAEVLFNGTSSAFVPVIRQDESSLELTIVLHIPNKFRFEDISVQTVDDRVIVLGKKTRISLPHGVTFNFRSNSSVLPTFRVMLQLPTGTDSRSISACLTRHHQLIIRGKLGPLSRRNTF